MNPPQMTDNRARTLAARAARQREVRSTPLATRRAFPLQYDEAGFPIRQPMRSFSERVRQLLLG